MNEFTNAFSQQVPEETDQRNVLADYAQAGAIDHAAVRAGIELFDKAKPHLIERADRWPYFRQDMVNLGFPSQWLPENFQSAEDLKQFIDHADRVNEQMRLTLADYPIRKKSQLPTRPSTTGVYDPLAEFQGLTQEAYKLGIAPPASPSPEDILKFKVQLSPWLEQKRIENYKPGLGGKGWSGTWGI